MLIRSERQGDIEATDAVDTLSFPILAEAQLVRRQRQAARLAVSIVAAINRAAIGHPISTTDVAIGGGLGPIVVWELPHWRGRIGRELAFDASDRRAVFADALNRVECR